MSHQLRKIEIEHYPVHMVKSFLVKPKSLYFPRAKCCILFSLRSKRFPGVGEQSKTKERGFQCFARAKNGARAKITNRGGHLLFYSLHFFV